MSTEKVAILDSVKDEILKEDDELTEWSKENVADPWLIAVASTYGYTIITFEKPLGVITNPTNKPKIPDVAKQFEVRCENLYYLMRNTGIRM